MEREVRSMATAKGAAPTCSAVRTILTSDAPA